MVLTFKKIIVAIICLFSFTFSNAQENNSFAGLRLGYALPMGEFASHEFGIGGYALLGKSICGEAAWFINKNLGFGLDVSFKTFGLATGYYADDYVESIPSYEKMDLLSGPYRVRTFNCGVYYKIQLFGKFNSTFKLMGGIFNGRTPDQLYVVQENQIEHFFWKTASSAWNSSFLAGASLEYNIYDHVSLLLQADFTYAEPAFKFSTFKGTYTDKMKMPILQLQPGINIHF